jgi:hypothetical protein
MKLRLLTVLLMFSGLSFAQAFHYEGTPLMKRVGTQLYATTGTITVCSGVISAVSSCTPAMIYRDKELSQSISGGVVQTDANGNWGFWGAQGDYTAFPACTGCKTADPVYISLPGPSGGNVDGADIKPKSVVVGDAETPAKGVIEVTNASGTTSITLDGDAGICSATAPIDVKACYGAKGNGTTDDTAAIQAAVNAALARNNGGEVLFPSGLYRVTGTVNVGLGDRPRGHEIHTLSVAAPCPAGAFF